MALSVWLSGCYPRQSLTGVGITCKEMLFVRLNVSWTDSYIGFWKLPGFFIFIYDESRIIIRCELNPYFS